MMDWTDWKGKKVYILLLNNREYSGRVLDVNGNLGNAHFIEILDKFNKKVTFLTTEIAVIQEEG